MTLFTPSLGTQHVTIVGLGLMGGSLALALKGKVGRLTAVEPHGATRQYALRHNLVDSVTDNLRHGLKKSDLVIFATPVTTLIRLIEELPDIRPYGCSVIDIGSTKKEVCAAMDQLPNTFEAIGGHPMCGKETAGIDAATPDLYADSTFILTRTQRTTPAIEALALELISALKSRPLFLSAKEHDAFTAAVSHMPFVVSSLLMETVATQADAQRRGDERLWQVSATGFRDSTRLSGSDPAMLRGILLSNREAVLAQLARYQANLSAFIELLGEGDADELTEWLHARNGERALYLQKKFPNGR